MAQLSVHAPRTPVLNETSSFVGATEKHNGTLMKWKMILVIVMKLLRSHTRDTAEISDRKWPSVYVLLSSFFGQPLWPTYTSPLLPVPS